MIFSSGCNGGATPDGGSGGAASVAKHPTAGGVLTAAVVLAALGGFCRPAAAGTVRVVTTTPGYADIVRQIGGDHVSAASIMRGPENVHNVSPTPSRMMKLKRAKLFVHSGLDGEPWVPLLIKGSRNRNLLPGQPGNVDVSKGIRLMEVPKSGQLTRALGDIHAFGNTHYALDPLNDAIIARTIAGALKRTDPKHAKEFDANLDRYVKRLRDLTDRLVERMAPYRGTPVVTYHRTWPYFLARFGLESIGEVEPKPGISPGPRHLSACVEKMRAAGARIIIVETFNSLKNAEQVAHRSGGTAVVLAQEVGALPGVETYEQLFEYDVEQLLAAFRDGGAAGGPASGDAGAESNRSVGSQGLE